MILTALIHCHEGVTAESAKPYQLAIGGGASGGIFNLVATGMATVINRYNPDIKASEQGTAASLENVRLVGSNKLKLGLGNTDIGYYGFKGEREFKQSFPELRAVMSSYMMYVYFLVRADSKIQSMSDFKGKKIAVGAPGGGPDSVSRVLFPKYAGLERDKDYTPYFINVAESMEALKDRTVDVAFVILGKPASSIIDITESIGVRFIEIPSELMNRIVKEHPYWFKTGFKAGEYKGLKTDVTTMGIPALMFTNTSVPEDVIYKVTKTLLEKADDLGAIHPVGKEFKLESVKNGVAIPFHPGAKKYYMEKGVKVD